MVDKKPRNLAASIRARLLARSRTDRADFQVLLTRYALERLLYRLGVSDHRDGFILKGAMLFATWLDDPFRPTRDLDLLGTGTSDAEIIATIFREVCATPVDDDGLVFDHGALQASAIRAGMEEGGVRVRLTARLAGAVIPIQIDIGFGDVVTPAPVMIDYPTLLDAPSPRLLAYPVETVIAEKLEAGVRIGVANTRLKDFYDLWHCAQTFAFRMPILRAAVHTTFAQRGTPLPTGVPGGLGDPFAAAAQRQWRAFLTRDRMKAAPEDLAQVLDTLRTFLMPLLDAAEPPDMTWPPGGPWRLDEALA